VPRVAGVPAKQATACAFEIGIHNSALAMVIAVNVLDSTAMAVPASVYVIAVWPPAVVLGYLVRRSARRAPESDQVGAVSRATA
jgi:BASS family bile acid:Na+ symporter